MRLKAGIKESAYQSFRSMLWKDRSDVKDKKGAAPGWARDGGCRGEEGKDVKGELGHEPPKSVRRECASRQGARVIEDKDQ